MNERKEQKQQRNWLNYNEQLVNRGKKRRPFSYPHSLILLPYRQLEGLARGLKKLIGIPAPDYSTLSLRLPRLDLDPNYEPKEGEPIVIAVDATGIKVTNRGEWMRKKHKGYVVRQAQKKAKVLGDGGYDRGRILILDCFGAVPLAMTEE